MPENKKVSPKLSVKTVRLGNLPVQRVATKALHWSDAYHWILTLTWPHFFLMTVGFYLSVNVLFALAYLAIPGTIVNARTGSFLDAFFFSIETLATVGYGVMSPATVYGHIIASTEILLGMLGIATITGLLFARFSRPTARIIFARTLVIRDFNGVRTLMLRAGNERTNLILEASVRISLIRKEITLEGERFYRVYDLKLDRDRSSAFALSWTIMHRIDETSPLYGKTSEDLHADDVTITVAISGQDETLNDMVHARSSYEAHQIAFDHKYVDILHESDEVWRVDMTRFHDIVAVGAKSD